MKIEAGNTLLMIGDSITDVEHARPVGEGNGLGGGYVSLVNALINAVHPENTIRILNTGISGNRVTDLELRWDEDVLAHNPDWLSIMIGINDVWRHFDSPLMPGQVDLQMYEEKLEALIVKTLPSIKGLVLMTPFYLEPNTEEPLRAMMDQYSAVVKKLAERYEAVFVDVQAAFDKYLVSQRTQTLCHDRVHPNLTGHMLIAKAFVDAINFTW